MAVKRWIVAQGNKEKSRELAARLNIAPFAAHLLVARGMSSPEQTDGMFVSDDQPLCDPMEFIDMDKAAARILKAVDEFERIAVFGDYDADGVTATALLYSYLENLDANVLYMLPERHGDGYGLHMGTVDRMAEQNVKLIVTVDNGISAYEEVEYANSLGIDVVITDHHQPPEKIPNACAVVNPHRADCTGGYKYFAGVGVAFKLVCAMEGDSEFISDNYCDLVALGTIADIVPLTGENKRLVRRGLESISSGERMGISMLKNMSGLGNRKVSSGDVSFKLAPRINAAGRLGTPERAVRLLLSDDMEECRDLANELEDENGRRTELQRTISDGVWSAAARDPSVLYDRVVVVSGEGWHKGVIGIFAAQMCEQLGKPCFVLSVDGDTATGSGRSVEGFSIYDALSACSDLLDFYGGHDMAAGMTVKKELIEQFRQAINEYAASFGDMPAPSVKVDCMLPPERVNLELYRDSLSLEPFGAQNSAPVVGVRECTIKEIRGLGDNMHQRVTLQKGGACINVMCFKRNGEFFPFRANDTVDCIMSLSMNEGYRQDPLTRTVLDIRLSSTNVEKIIEGERLFEKLMRGEKLTAGEIEELTPPRDQLAVIYTLLKAGYKGDMETLSARMAEKGVAHGRLRVALEAMNDRGVLSVRRRGNIYSISPRRTEGRVKLEESEIYKRLEDCRKGIEEYACV